MTQKCSVVAVLSILLLQLGCGSTTSTSCTSHTPSHCSAVSPSILQNYDEMTQKYLDDVTIHPPNNFGGYVIWNTRYYLESLLTAYSATGNRKYIQSFLDSGSSVLQLAQTIVYPAGVDPSAPGAVATGQTVTATGWPTYMGTFGVPVAIPTASGQVAMYAQSLYPASDTGANFLQVTPQADGSSQLTWYRNGVTLPSYTVRTVNDLKRLASLPLVYQQSPGRIKPTGAGLPAPGNYEIDTPLLTIWHAEQTGGMLLPFVEFLLIAKNTPGLVPDGTFTAWQSQVISIATSYENEYVSDGTGGLIIMDADWLTGEDAGLPAAADYVYVEATMRLLIYELTGDANELALAKGLMLHLENYHMQSNSTGWLLLKVWPCIHPWTTRSEGFPESIWDSLQYDPDSPQEVIDGGFLADLMHFAKAYNLADDLGFNVEFFSVHQNTISEYLTIPPGSLPIGAMSFLRNNYPTATAKASDPPSPSSDVFASSGFLRPEISNDAFITANWDWIVANGQSPQGQPIGYFLRAWARSEAAAVRVRTKTSAPAIP
jgi:hypothetical protein